MYPAPASKVVKPPGQNCNAPVIAGDGTGEIVVVTFADPEQPFEFLAVTVYFAAAFTFIVWVIAPVDHK